MQKAHEITKDARFSYYWLCDDTGISREEMLRRALEDRSGIRENLTALEEVRVFKLFKDVDLSKVAASDQRERYGRLARAAEAFSGEGLGNLHKIEVNAGGSYAFNLPSLEFLSGIPEGPDLYMTAAEIAVNRYDQSRKKLEDAYAFRSEVTGLEWFVKLFPSANATEEQKGAASGEGGQEEGGEGNSNSASPDTNGQQKPRAGDRVQAGKKKRKRTKKKQTGRQLLRLEEGVLTVACPFCRGPVPFQPSTIQFEGNRLSLEGKPSTPVAAELVTGMFSDTCELCGKDFSYEVTACKGQYHIRTEKTRTDAAEAAGSLALPEDVVWDEDGRCWGVLDKQGKVAKKLPVMQSKAPTRRERRQREGKGRKGGRR
jgi:hypothetical protein